MSRRREGTSRHDVGSRAGSNEELHRYLQEVYRVHSIDSGGRRFSQPLPAEQSADDAAKAARTGEGVRSWLKLRWSPLLSLVLLLFVAAAIRFGLLILEWPASNSDEGTMGLMAMHIAEGRDFPSFMYGQSYMG